MRSQYQGKWQERARLSLGNFRPSQTGEMHLDVHALIRIATDRQHETLYNSLAPRERAYLQELRDVRNRYAHQERLDDADVERALDTMERFLSAISSPEVSSIRGLRTPPAPAASKRLREYGASATTAGPEGPVERVRQSDQGAADLQKGVRLFRHLAELANRGDAVGIGYADFIAFVHGKNSFREFTGRDYLPSDSRAVIELAWSVTRSQGGRIAVGSPGHAIQCGMDSFVWASNPPHDRPLRAWKNPQCILPYTPAEWRTVFRDGKRRLIKPRELATLV